jgi:hypothetical protein
MTVRNVRTLPTLRTPGQFTVRLKKLPGTVELGWLFSRCADLCVVSSPRRDVASVLVDRYAPSVVDAVISAIRDLDTVGLIPVSVEPFDDLAPDWTPASWDGRSERDDADPIFVAINLALRLRALAPLVGRIAAIRSLISG